MDTVLAVQIITAAVAVLAIGRLAYGVVQRKTLIARGYGISAVESIDTNGRNVDAKVVRVPEVVHAWSTDAVADRPYTVITVEHDAGDIEGRYEGEAAARIDPESLESLLGRTSDTGVASAAINFERLGFVRGVVHVGPRAIRFVEPGDLLEPEYVRAVVRELVEIADQHSRAGAREAAV